MYICIVHLYQESCKHGDIQHPACLLRLGLATPTLRDSLRVMQLLELITHLVLLRGTPRQRALEAVSTSLDQHSEKSLSLKAVHAEPEEVIWDETSGEVFEGLWCCLCVCGAACVFPPTSFCFHPLCVPTTRMPTQAAATPPAEEDGKTLLTNALHLMPATELVAVASAATRARAPLVTAIALEVLRQVCH